MVNKRTRGCSAPRRNSERVFRQVPAEKGRNRDTAWIAAIDTVRPARRVCFEQWQDPANFEGNGRQITPLGRLTEGVRVALSPKL